jgi:putative transposase
MKRKRHTPQEIIAKLREAEANFNQGATIEAVCRKLEISEQTFHR